MSVGKELVKDSKKVWRRIKCLGILGAILVAIGASVLLCMPWLVDRTLDNELQIRREGNRVTDGWLEMPLPLTTNIYIFTIDNPSDFLRGAKPVLRQMGPYVYV